VDKLITKLILATISKEELLELKTSLDDSKKRDELENYLKVNYNLNLSTLEINTDKAYQETSKRIKFHESKVKTINLNILKYAAVVLVLIGFAWFFKDNIINIKEDNLALVPKDEVITLELSDGKILPISITDNNTITNNDKIISYQSLDTLIYVSEEIVNNTNYNTLKIPNGKKFILRLSDNTLVHLNSGSSIRYPVSFPSHEKREVFLKGEAYFEVFHDNKRPFIVNTDNSYINVLGTKFNISSYQEDEITEVVLVDGSVSFQDKVRLKNEVVLKPNQRAVLENNAQYIDVTTVRASLYTAWMQDELIFRNMSFNNIINDLERHYSIEIENNNKELGNDIFNASFDSIPIKDVLDFFKELYDINYSIRNNKVVID
jgi:hypothetical protein